MFKSKKKNIFMLSGHKHSKFLLAVLKIQQKLKLPIVWPALLYHTSTQSLHQQQLSQPHLQSPRFLQLNSSYTMNKMAIPA